MFRKEIFIGVLIILICVSLLILLISKKEGGKMKVLMIVAPGNFRDEELFEPKKILEENGVEVVVASIKEGEFTGMLGGKIYAKSLDDVNLEEFDGVILVGGTGVIENNLFENEKIHEVVRYFYENGKVVGAECVSPAILAKSGILNGKKATVWKDEKFINMLKEGGAEYVEENVVVDGKIITGAGPFAAKEFGEKYLELLNR